MAVDELIIVEITDLAPGGDAVGRQVGGASAGRVTFVPLAAPGERVRAKIEREKRRVAWAALVEIERPSSGRVAPPCRLFGECGGCQWQHVSRSEQVAAKRAIVARALGLADVPIDASLPDFGYRARARLVVGRDRAGGAVVGFRERRSHAVVDVPACPLMAPSLQAAWTAVRLVARLRPPGSEVPVLAGNDGTVTARLDSRFLEWRVSSPLHQVSPARESQALVDVSEPNAPPLLVPPDGFSQVGPAANALLVSAVLQAVGTAPGHVVELFAGSGNFTRHLLGRAASVLAHDGDRAAVMRGRLNAAQADWRHEILSSDVGRADTIVVDPPREGLDERHLALVCAARDGARLTYVSCDPQTLARDAGRLRSAGFRLLGAQALDLMPQTFHVEVVTTWLREGRSLLSQEAGLPT